MHRLFVAIRPSAAVRAQLLALMEGVGGARWQRPTAVRCGVRMSLNPACAGVGTDSA
jgi:2'-5' RNA ligase